MDLGAILGEVLAYMRDMGTLELTGLIFGLLCVYFLIKENILTWVCGIIYVLISFIVFWQARLFGDLLLHLVFLVLNIYGWIHWTKGGNRASKNDLPITTNSWSSSIFLIACTGVGIFIFKVFLETAPGWFQGVPEADLPFWDSTTSVLSITGMWLTARKKIDNWYYWFVVDILATGIYFYKGMYFYSILYFIYIGMAVAGYISWSKSMKNQAAS